LKLLISTEEIEQYAKQGLTKVCIDPATIVTAAARDLASQKGISFDRTSGIPKSNDQAVVKNEVMQETHEASNMSGMIDMIKSQVVDTDSPVKINQKKPFKGKVDPSILSVIINGVMAMVADMPKEFDEECQSDEEPEDGSANPIKGGRVIFLGEDTADDSTKCNSNGQSKVSKSVIGSPSSILS